ncbi:MAG TPA: sigma-70 family RNA polymerase sigma factor, partial [Salegentibacter sp.]|nr:sigma-70 family RNA polymerase sigma factor [Salegentibacter sp.]
VINTTLQKHRKEKYFEIINENLSEDPEIEIDDEKITTDFLLESIQELPERYRQVFNLYALDGFSHKEIAEMLNISVGSSKSNLARARHILKSRIENHLNDNKVQSL